MKKFDKLYDLAFILIAFIFFNILISTSLFIVKVSIHKINFILALLLTIGLYIFIMIKHQYAKKDFIISLSVFLLIILGSIFISGKLYDVSYDGNSYHKAAIGELKNGWNPVYSSIADFNNSSKNPLKLANVYEIWNDHYAKGYQIYAANVYKITNNIETGKSMQIITIIATMFICFSFLKSKMKLDYAIVLSMLMALNPVMLCQMNSYYNDSLNGNFLFILVIVLTLICKKDKNISSKQNLFLYFMSLCILINIKFTGFVFAGIYSMFYYIYIISNKELRKSNLKVVTITAVCSLIVGLGIIGLSTYPKNMIDHGHPFYPLYGKNKVDIMYSNTPKGFHSINYLKRFVFSNFSKSFNSGDWGGKGYELKLPFTFEASEINMFIYPDVRVAGYGVLFGGILLLAIGEGIYALVCFTKTKKKETILYLLPIMATGFTIVALKENWWARYLPQLFFMPFIVTLMLSCLSSKKSRLFLGVTICVIFFNFWLILNPVFKGISVQKKLIDQEFEVLKNAKGKVLVYTETFDGSLFDLKDHYSNIEVVGNNTIDYEVYFIMGNHINTQIYIKNDK